MKLPVDQLLPGTEFRFTQVPPCCDATLGVVYVVEISDGKDINWRRSMAEGWLGYGSFDSISSLRHFGAFESAVAL